MDAYRPLVGITTRQEPGKVEFYLPRHYPEAIHAAGGLPLLIPLIDSPEYLRRLMERLDGIIFSGSGTDVDPRHYGQDAAAHLGPVNPLRDAVDMCLAGEALQGRMPVFAICYGFQMLNVRLGGSLVQDIPSLHPGAVRHKRSAADDPMAKHPVDLAPGSLLEKLAGGARVEVNSSHHQAIDRLASELAAAATSPDGLVEAALDRSGRPVLAVQWHPERSFFEDPFSRRMFACFIDWCRDFHARKGRGGP